MSIYIQACQMNCHSVYIWSAKDQSLDGNRIHPVIKINDDSTFSNETLIMTILGIN